jgi:hypothetical protein
VVTFVGTFLKLTPRVPGGICKSISLLEWQPQVPSTSGFCTWCYKNPHSFLMSDFQTRSNIGKEKNGKLMPEM